jgi:hypothetical protein
MVLSVQIIALLCRSVHHRMMGFIGYGFLLGGFIASGFLTSLWAKTDVQETPALLQEVPTQQIAMFWDRFKTKPKQSSPSPQVTRPQPALPPSSSPTKPSEAQVRQLGTHQTSQSSQNSQITSPFGWRVHPVTKKEKFHTGIDIAATTGTPIRAILPGRVVFSGVYGGYGQAIVIQHGLQHYTLYGHASQLLVPVGVNVRAGEVIALVGATGVATGPHLHFEVRLQGVFQDPMPYLKAIQLGKDPIIALRDPSFMAYYAQSQNASPQAPPSLTAQRATINPVKSNASPLTPSPQPEALSSITPLPTTKVPTPAMTRAEVPQNWMMQEAWEPGQEALDIAPETASETPQNASQQAPIITQESVQSPYALKMP